MRLSRAITVILLRVGVGLTLAFIYVPLLVIVIYAFNEGKTLAWPPAGLHPRLVRRRRSTTPGARDAFVTSMKAGLAATAIALVLGTLASLAVARHRFFGRETISFLVILPIALPGIVTGIALNDTFTQVLGIDLEPVHGRRRPRDLLHRRRLQQRRSPGCGASRPRSRRPRPTSAPTPWQTFRCVTLPEHAHRAGRRRACWPSRSPSTRSSSPRSRSAPATRRCRSGSSTTSSRPNQLPIVNVVAVFVILISIIPVYFANKLSQDVGGGGGRAGGAKPEGLTAEATAAP